MILRALFYPALLVLAALLALDPHGQSRATAFEIRHALSSNATSRNRLMMMPLRLDNAILSSRRAAAETSDAEGASPPPPRGIVLNTAVGGLTLAGGLMGYATKGSKASLVAGSAFGGLLMLAGFLVWKSSESRSAKGNVLGSLVSGLLGYVMGKKFLGSKKFMPAGLLTVLSAVGVVYNLIEIKILSAAKQADSTPPSEPDDSETTDSTE